MLPPQPMNIFACIFQTKLEILKAELRSANDQIKDQSETAEMRARENKVSLLHVPKYAVFFPHTTLYSGK